MRLPSVMFHYPSFYCYDRSSEYWALEREAPQAGIVWAATSTSICARATTTCDACRCISHG